MNDVSPRKPSFIDFSPRQRIMAAALKLFVEQGYFNTNVPDLSRESKCSVGSIYHSFKNKEEVARALYEEALSAFRGALANSIHDIDDTEEIIKTLVKSLLSFSQINVQLSKYIWLCRHDEFMTGMIKHPTRVGHDQLGRKVAKSIKIAMRKKEIRVLKANIIWSIVFGIPLSYVRDWLDGYNTETPNQVADQLAEVCWQALKAK